MIDLIINEQEGSCCQLERWDCLLNKRSIEELRKRNLLYASQCRFLDLNTYRRPKGGFQKDFIILKIEFRAIKKYMAHSVYI